MPRTLLDQLQVTCRNIRGVCADCDGPIGQDTGPSDGWQLEDGRTVCHACCCLDFRRSIDVALAALVETTNTARRPKTLKERGREALQNIHNAVVMETGGRELDVLKAIVESLPD